MTSELVLSYATRALKSLHKYLEASKYLQLLLKAAFSLPLTRKSIKFAVTALEEDVRRWGVTRFTTGRNSRASTPTRLVDG